jgi:hypothetical protein
VRVRDHIVLSTAGAALVSPWIGQHAIGLWAGSVLIDVDHYLWFCVRHRSLDPVAAVRLFTRAQAPQQAETRILHSPGALLAACLLAVARPRLLPIAVGMSIHVALDARHEARMNRARTKVLERDERSCQDCGVRGPNVGTHIQRQPWLLPSYEPENLIALCGACHEAAHARAAGAA